jgi:hypothetical protein
MTSAIGKVFILLLVVLGTFLWIGSTITDLTGGEKDIAAVGKVDISPEGGEEIFWGKGRCYTCHSVGDRGSAVRCPNLGVFGQKFALAIGARASERAKLRSEKTGPPTIWWKAWPSPTPLWSRASRTKWPSCSPRRSR